MNFTISDWIEGFKVVCIEIKDFGIMLFHGFIDGLKQIFNR